MGADMQYISQSARGWVVDMLYAGEVCGEMVGIQSRARANSGHGDRFVIIQWLESSI